MGMRRSLVGQPVQQGLQMFPHPQLLMPQPWPVFTGPFIQQQVIPANHSTAPSQIQTNGCAGMTELTDMRAPRLDTTPTTHQASLLVPAKKQRAAQRRPPSNQGSLSPVSSEAIQLYSPRTPTPSLSPASASSPDIDQGEHGMEWLNETEWQHKCFRRMKWEFFGSNVVFGRRVHLGQVSRPAGHTPGCSLPPSAEDVCNTECRHLEGIDIL